MTDTVTLAPEAPAPARSPLALDLPALHAWLAPRLPGWPATLAHGHASRLTGGQSNPTWLLESRADPARPQAWVLRAKPGPAATLLPSAHAIERECQVMQALWGTPVPVPPVLLACDDESVIGASFYVMGHVAGRIFRDATLPELAPPERAAVHDEANRVIAALHDVDWRARGLAGYGREDAFFERLTARWTRQYRASLTTGPMPAMEQLLAWLPQHIPAAAAHEPITLTHGDFRLENLIYHPSEPRVLAVLDWELSTLGHPLSDLAYHCMAWHLPSPPLQGFGGRPDLAALGIPSQRDYIAHYLQRRHPQDDPAAQAERLQALAADWPFYLACNLFRLAAILQGIARRVADGTAASPVAVQTGAMAGPVAELGWAVASGQRPAL